MRKFVQEALNKTHWAVVGATQSHNKFGYKIFNRLVEKGYDVTPVNPFHSEIDGVVTVANIAETQGIQVVNMVISPEKCLKVLETISDMGIEVVWFQPGSYNDDVIQRANDLGLKVIYGYCVLVELG